jgi:hemerythrin-like metal-binding protein
MGLFKWSRAYSVYLPEIDAEHRAIFQLAEELHKGIAAGTDLAKLRPVLANLMASAEAHFKHEERIMFAAHYTALAWHKKQHDAVRWRVKRLVRRMDCGDPDAAGELLEFLDSWLQTHTRVSDRMMGAYLRNVLRFNTTLAS